MSANRDNLTSSFSVYIPFISFSCLIVLAKNSSTKLNKGGESRHPCFIPDFRGNAISFANPPPHLVQRLLFVIHNLYYIEVCSFFFFFLQYWGLNSGPTP
jgi:hypothetical protein